jgi:hypothetical protein
LPEIVANEIICDLAQLMQLLRNREVSPAHLGLTMWRLSLLAMPCAALAPLLVALWTAPDAYAAVCPSRYPPPAHMAEVKARVAAMHLIEREAADRSVGLDTRPYEWLLDQARVAEKAIHVPELVAAEEELLKRCFVPPLRTSCAIGSAALVRVIEDLKAGRDTNEAKMALAQTMPHCERIVGLAPVNTSLRAFKWPPQDPDSKRLRPAPR